MSPTQSTKATYGSFPGDLRYTQSPTLRDGPHGGDGGDGAKAAPETSSLKTRHKKCYVAFLFVHAFCVRLDSDGTLDAWARLSQRTQLSLSIQLFVLRQEYALLFHLSDLPPFPRGLHKLAALQAFG